MIRRDWRNYSKDKLVELLSGIDWSDNANDVQQIWNNFENKLVLVIDRLVPLTEFVNDKIKVKLCPTIKRKLNIRNRLLKQLKRNPTLELKRRIKQLNAEIKNHFHSEKKKEVRRCILPGNSKSLWNAVKVSKNMGTGSLPKAMTVNGVKVDVHERSNLLL